MGASSSTTSTRGAASPQTFTDILLEGLAPDGGLYVPESYPQFDAAKLAAMRRMTYPELAFAILSKFADDIPAADFRTVVSVAGTESNVVLKVRAALLLLTLMFAVKLALLARTPGVEGYLSSFFWAMLLWVLDIETYLGSPPKIR